ncbi:MAG: hypothetical protein ABFC94_03950 [Syntrophomonas sp.]
MNLRGAPSPARQAVGVSAAGDWSKLDMPHRPVLAGRRNEEKYKMFCL